MRSRRSFIALLIAIGFHALVLAFFVKPDTKPVPVPVVKERFGIKWQEEPVLSEAVTSISSARKGPDTTAQVMPNPVQTAPITAEKNPADVVMSESKPYTSADTDILPASVIHHYGDAFFELSAGEQHYIIDNLQRIRKINEIVGTKILRERPDTEIDPGDSNIVEFTLYPDGSVSDVQLQKNRVGTLLDELTLQTITLAHEKYPRPEQKTLIRIRVYIIVK